MRRRDLLRCGMIMGGALPLAEPLAAGKVQHQNSKDFIVDCHCHAGKGETMSAPWTSYADPLVTLRRAEEAGIDRTVIFPISNPTYEKANREIADIVARYPDRFIGFAKHDPVSESGKIRAMLTGEVREMGLKGLKLHQLPTCEVLDTVAELKIPVLFHPPKVADFHQIASLYPEVSFIMAHLEASRRAITPSTWPRSTWPSVIRTFTWKRHRSSSSSTSSWPCASCRRRRSSSAPMDRWSTRGWSFSRFVCSSCPRGMRRSYSRETFSGCCTCLPDCAGGHWTTW